MSSAHTHMYIYEWLIWRRDVCGISNILLQYHWTIQPSSSSLAAHVKLYFSCHFMLQLFQIKSMRNDFPKPCPGDWLAMIYVKRTSTWKSRREWISGKVKALHLLPTQWNQLKIWNLKIGKWKSDEANKWRDASTQNLEFERFLFKLKIEWIHHILNIILDK